MSRLLPADGRVAVAVATTGTDPRTCRDQAREARRAGADLVELRADLLAGAPDPVRVARTAACLSAELGEKPLLVTVRSAAEGGRARLDDDAYRDLVVALCEESRALPPGSRPAGIDIELERVGAAGLAELVDRAHAADLSVVSSFHDVHATPSDEDLLHRLTVMARSGADVAKIAVMPEGPGDVARLLALTVVAHQELPMPLATMAMGVVGVVSRVAGGVFGSTLTFATAGAAASAPGQPPIEELRRAMALLGAG